MKIMLLAGLYLFFVRVLWSVYSELRDPRTIARKRNDVENDPNATVRRPAADAPQAPAVAPTARPMVPVGAVATALATGTLMIVDPPQRAGTSYSLGSEITIGRAETNGILLDDTYVSTVHARIFATNGTYFVEDLASRNGSNLNGQPLSAATALTPGDRLQVGSTTLEFS